ncbi:MAG: hypothetical protein KGL35_11885 [Bradyrhizobium sp.]|nr:hypothetical protein [Bradyrhizobium sp.]
MNPAIVHLPELAQAAYDPTNWAIHLPKSDVRAMVRSEDGELMVAIPGTDPSDLRDDLADFADLVRRDHPVIGVVGEGPSRRADALWTMLRARVPPIWFLTGHSLGGAIAHDIVALALKENRPPSFVMTLAAPLCLGTIAAGHVAVVQGVDFARHGDPVPYVPDLPWLGRPRQLTMLGERVFLPSLSYHAVEGYRALADEWLAQYSLPIG